MVVDWCRTGYSFVQKFQTGITFTSERGENDQLRNELAYGIFGFPYNNGYCYGYQRFQHINEANRHF